MCVTPYNVKNPHYRGGSDQLYIPVPCGKCPACLARRTSAWSFRLLQEDKVASCALFITLTYDNDHVNISPNGFMTLVKKDWQDFMKRVRFASPTLPKIKYYCAGEYGSQTMRPHFHAIIFGADREIIERCWTKGSVWFGDVSGASVAYTAKYINKGKVIPVHANDDRVPECSMMSKGLGISYLSDAVVKYHQEDLSRNYVVLDGGVKVSLPRYFREKIYSEQDRAVQAKMISQRQVEMENERQRKYVEDNGSLDRYTFDRYQSIKQSLEQFRSQEKSKRNKI